MQYFGRKIKAQAAITYEKVAWSSKSLQENIDLIELCKLCDRGRFNIRRYLKIIIQAFRSFIKLKKLEVLNNNILGFIGAVLPLSVLAYGGYEIISGVFTIGKQYATRDEVLTALMKARAWEFIEKLEDKEQTLVGEGGNRFSTGQKQRIAIARALIKGADILILDEATSNIDNLSDKYITETIDEISREKIVIFISHKTCNIINSDQILVLNSGRIVEQGNHQDLLKQKGHYSSLYEPAPSI